MRQRQTLVKPVQMISCTQKCVTCLQIASHIIASDVSEKVRDLGSVVVKTSMNGLGQEDAEDSRPEVNFTNPLDRLTDSKS